MGSCVSVHKDSDSTTKIRFSIGSKNDKLLIPSPVKEKPVSVSKGDRTAADVAVSSLRSPARYTSIGSKDEAFFDSQPWLESDCEDDFVSVNGDFSSSRGNTPVHPNSSANKLPLEEANGSVAEPPTPDKKKRLSQFFKESLLDDEYDNKEKSAVDQNEAPTSTTLAQQLKTPNDLSRANEEEDKSFRSTQCCLPKMLSSRSLNERRKRMSPSANGG